MKQHPNSLQTALEALLENFGDRPQTLEILNQVLINDSDEQLRKFAKERLRDGEMGRLGRLIKGASFLGL